MPPARMTGHSDMRSCSRYTALKSPVASSGMLLADYFTRAAAMIVSIDRRGRLGGGTDKRGAYEHLDSGRCA